MSLTDSFPEEYDDLELGNDDCCDTLRQMTCSEHMDVMTPRPRDTCVRTVNRDVQYTSNVGRSSRYEHVNLSRKSRSSGSNLPLRYTLQLKLRHMSVVSLLPVILTIVLLGFEPVASAPAGSGSRSYSEAEYWYRGRETMMVKYLGEFGYLQDASRENGPAGLMSKEAFVEALKNLQRMGHIPETGVIDRRTLELMKKPRCGVVDVQPMDEKRRRKRFVHSPSKWDHTDLTYRIMNHTPDLSADKVRRIIYNAFKVWSDVTTLTFTETMNHEADIMILFAEGYHHDGYPFDGKGSVLAHAFFPGDDKGGDTHFDDAETWTFNSSDGVDLFMVAAHEFGHALGLAHSPETSALMYPWYQGYTENFQLPTDDVNGIQALYGSKGSVFDRTTPRAPVTRPSGGGSNVTPRPPYVTPKPDKDEEEDPCYGDVDAITVIRREVFIFKGSKFWRYQSADGLTQATQISKFWYDLPADGIDALYERKDGKIMFFKGDRFWLYSSNHMVTNFPKEGRRITELGIDEDVKKIDAVFIWAYNKRTYVVTGDMYWKLDEKDNYIEFDYPRDMSIWRNVPVPLDSAFQHWDEKTYFLKGDQYWEFYDNKMRTRRKEGSPIAKLFNCRSSNRKSDKQDLVDLAQTDKKVEYVEAPTSDTYVVETKPPPSSAATYFVTSALVLARVIFTTVVFH